MIYNVYETSHPFAHSSACNHDEAAADMIRTCPGESQLAEEQPARGSAPSAPSATSLQRCNTSTVHEE